MLVKLNDFPDDLAETLCFSTGHKTASKAVMATIADWHRLAEFEKDAQLRISCMVLEIERLRRVVEGARSAAALLLEKTGQCDLLADSDRLPFLRRVDVFED